MGKKHNHPSARYSPSSRACDNLIAWLRAQTLRYFSQSLEHCELPSSAHTSKHNTPARTPAPKLRVRAHTSAHASARTPCSRGEGMAAKGQRRLHLCRLRLPAGRAGQVGGLGPGGLFRPGPVAQDQPLPSQGCGGASVSHSRLKGAALHPESF